MSGFTEPEPLLVQFAIVTCSAGSCSVAMETFPQDCCYQRRGRVPWNTSIVARDPSHGERSIQHHFWESCGHQGIQWISFDFVWFRLISCWIDVPWSFHARLIPLIWFTQLCLDWNQQTLFRNQGNVRDWFIFVSYVLPSRWFILVRLFRSILRASRCDYDFIEL